MNERNSIFNFDRKHPMTGELRATLAAFILVAASFGGSHASDTKVVSMPSDDPNRISVIFDHQNPKDDFSNRQQRRQPDRPQPL